MEHKLNLISWGLTNNGNDNLYIKRIDGDQHGVFSNNHLPKGTILFQLRGHIVTIFEPVTEKPPACFKLIEKNNQFLLPDKESLISYVRHNNDPNTYLTADLQLISTAEITRGEELLADHRQWL
jgi:hypothetical protein